MMSDTLLPSSQSASTTQEDLEPSSQTQGRKKRKARTLDMNRDSPRSNERVDPSNLGHTRTSRNFTVDMGPNAISQSSTDGALEQQHDDRLQPEVIERRETRVADGSSTHPYVIGIYEDSSKTSSDPEAQPIFSTPPTGGPVLDNETENTATGDSTLLGSTSDTLSTEAGVGVSPPSRALDNGAALPAQSNELDMDIVEAEATDFLRQ